MSSLLTSDKLGTVTIYKLTLVSWSDGKLTDFDLPKIVGHYLTLLLAMRGRAADVEGRSRALDPDDRTTANDYTIEPIHVYTRVNPRG